MPFDSMLVVAGVICMFAVFAAAILWADIYSSGSRSKH